jgi:phage anti-repressor protein
MRLNTMAAVMTQISKLELDSAAYYEDLAAKFPALADLFSKWAKENQRQEKVIKQTYYGVITDTLESNYAFEGLETDDFNFDLTPAGDEAGARTRAMALEEAIAGFYQKTAKLSQGLMADVPRVLKRVANKRLDRVEDME